MMIELKEWLLKHIEENPDISFGSVYRDACMTRNMIFNAYDDNLFNAITQLESEGFIQVTKKDNNTFYNLDQNFIRNKLIDQITND
jgi:hypothetical protein